MWSLLIRIAVFQLHTVSSNTGQCPNFTWVRAQGLSPFPQVFCSVPRLRSRMKNSTRGSAHVFSYMYVLSVTIMYKFLTVYKLEKEITYNSLSFEKYHFQPPKNHTYCTRMDDLHICKLIQPVYCV